MGSSVSYAAAPPPPFALPPQPVGLAVALPPKSEEKSASKEMVDYMNLPCPVPFEEIQREALSMSRSLIKLRFLFLLKAFLVTILHGNLTSLLFDR